MLGSISFFVNGFDVVPCLLLFALRFCAFFFYAVVFRRVTTIVAIPTLAQWVHGSLANSQVEEQSVPFLFGCLLRMLKLVPLSLSCFYRSCAF